ncbi:uncharacterized protein LOC107672398 [Sinocyclocheilus anshuiensis]|uniref:uncharacterized protein LOC107672398 n=1 Tax=Sinocyclocheilus anshuiensis TaxID=1608454 RepID=UPI0007B93A9B|nr:PREDICTED: uncharacterized protein LOC107672398 [Sinocyclocheilus anshuiensis]
MWSVFFVFLSYLDRNFVKGEFLSQASEAEKESKELFYMLNNTLCAKSSVVGEYHLHQVTDGAEEVRSVHDSEGRLVDCSVIQNEMQVKSFMHVCRLGLRNQMSSDLKVSLTGVSEAKANCNKLKSKGDRNVTTTTKQAKEPNSDAANNKKTRTKRGFTYPGTLWCGAGNIADHYDQLGEFEETDQCCRVHDHCPYVIHAFSSNYGYTNFKWHSLSHCDCDNALKECLRLVNDTSSRVVGQAFFNVIEVPCFEFSFEEQCVERHWYGVCKKYDRVPVAVIKESIHYDFGGIDVIDVLTIAPPKKKQSDEEKQNATTSESTTQSSFSESKTAAPEEPSLTNMVTAAEDFIKVLATVSTSQSSSADAGKGETQTSEKKRKKNSSKKKKENKKKRGKGKGMKKNKKLGAVLKVDEGTTGVPSTGQTEEVMGKNNFAEEAAKMNRFRIKENNFMNSELDSEGNSNKMMRDDPQRTVNDNQDVVTITTSIKTDKEPEILQHRQANDTELVSTSPTAHITPAVRDKTRAKLRQRAGKKKRRKNNPSTEAKEQTLSTSPPEGVSLVTSKPESPAAAVRNEVMQSTMHTEEKGPVVTATQKTPIVRTKKPSLRQREGRKRMRKIIASSTEKPPRDISSQDPLLFTGSPTVGPTDVLERLGLDRLENPTESLKDTNGRKNKGRRVIKICYEAVLPDVADTTPLPTLIEKDTEFQLKDLEMNTAPMFPPLQTNTPSTATRRPRNTKMKRSRERGNREKRGKVKRE